MTYAPSQADQELVNEQPPGATDTVDSPLTAPKISAKAAAAIAYLDYKLQRDATDDPELIRQAEQEREELLRNLNANRAGTGELPIAL